MSKGQAEVSRWERGDSRPRYETLLRIARLDGKGIDIFQKQDALVGSRHVREESPEQAVAQTELEAELERVDQVVRLVGGKEEFSEDQRRGLKRDILNTYIDAFRDDGLDTRELYVMLGKVDRGEL